MMPEKIGRCILAPVLVLFLKWQIGTQGVDGMEEMSWVFSITPALLMMCAL